jgi:hypothetical protein
MRQALVLLWQAVGAALGRILLAYLAVCPSARSEYLLVLLALGTGARPAAGENTPPSACASRWVIARLLLPLRFFDRGAPPHSVLPLVLAHVHLRKNTMGCLTSSAYHKSIEVLELTHAIGVVFYVSVCHHWYAEVFFELINTGPVGLPGKFLFVGASVYGYHTGSGVL